MTRRRRRPKGRSVSSAQVPEDASPEALEGVRREAERLRRAGKASEARRLAEKALAVATDPEQRGKLCLEAALACFCLGEDTAAAAHAEGHPRAKELVAPLLAAAGATPRVVTPSRRAIPAARALGWAAAAVAHARAGAIERARRRLVNVPAEWGDVVGLDELRSAVTVAKGGRLGMFKLQQLRDAVGTLVHLELARTGPAGYRFRDRALTALVEAHDVARRDPVRGAMKLAAAEGFPEKDGLVSLFEAYGCARDNPRRAKRALAAAARAGVSPTEVARLTWMIRLDDWGSDGDEAAEAGVALAALYEAEPGGRGLAAMLYTMASTEALGWGRDRDAAAWIAAARRCVPPAMEIVCLPVEGALALEDDPARALALAERLCRHDPSQEGFWHLRLEATRRIEGELSLELLDQAFAATGAMRFRDAARRTRRAAAAAELAQGESSGLVSEGGPGALAAGLLARLEVLGEQGEQTRSEILAALVADAEARLDALPSAERTAVEVALVSKAATCPDGDAFVVDRLSLPWGHDAMERLCFAALAAELPEAVEVAGRRHLEAGRMEETLAAISALAHAGEDRIGEALFRRAAMHLTRKQVDRARRLLDGAAPLVPVELWEHPHLASARALLEPELVLDPPWDAEDDSAGPPLPVTLEGLAEQLDIPAEVIRGIPPQARAEIEHKLGLLFQTGRPELMMEILAGMADPFGAPSPSPRPKRRGDTKKKRNERKRRRKQRKKNRS